MTIALIDYGSGNLRSAQKAFEHVAARLPKQQEIVLTSDADIVARADAVVLPGVGAFGDCASGLRAIDGMEEALNQAVIEKARPFLGICVGMQLMVTRANEFGGHNGLDWIAGSVTALAPLTSSPPSSPPSSLNPALKIPHMGWNELRNCAPHPVLSNMEGRAVYFVHSFACCPEDDKTQLAACEYGGLFTAVIGRDNMIGAQFHPEKSQQAGLTLIENFLGWRP